MWKRRVLKWRRKREKWVNACMAGLKWHCFVVPRQMRQWPNWEFGCSATSCVYTKYTYALVHLRRAKNRGDEEKCWRVYLLLFSCASATHAIQMVFYVFVIAIICTIGICKGTMITTMVITAMFIWAQIYMWIAIKMKWRRCCFWTRAAAARRWWMASKIVSSWIPSYTNTKCTIVIVIYTWYTFRNREYWHLVPFSFLFFFATFILISCNNKQIRWVILCVHPNGYNSCCSYSDPQRQMWIIHSLLNDAYTLHICTTYIYINMSTTGSIVTHILERSTSSLPIVM